MRYHRIALLPGDGIGQDVIAEGVQTLNLLASLAGDFRLETQSFDWSCEYYLQHGRMMPPEALNTLREFDAIYFGAVGFPTVPDHVSLHGMLLPIRQEFDLYVNLRPIRLLPGLEGPLRGRTTADVNFVCVRENTEGEYARSGGRIQVGTPQEVATQTAIFTRQGTERIIRYAFELARREGRHKVTSATKSNALQYSMVFWDEVYSAVAAEYPDITADKWHVDALAARFVTHPQTLDVVVSSNLFGDILTDLGGALQGSLGLPPSGNIHPVAETRRGPSLFEPVHGSAPDIAGKGIANPIGGIWSGQIMLEYLGEREAATQLMRAIEAVTAAREVLTPDLGGRATTVEVGKAIRTALRKLYK
ncbi:tartrate dehydrogenase [Ktedonosporobacter rubrisoli]|uniref:D-malate dehydrogenase (decarboxylating) n=1 Tax=Ktedonosporobacter rubrisoli TaxID=2509675 RepID=A0A4P6JU57_KTERU|nr:tartrate dehydrogenase [Ktedonosporobacter rubrisoli]QBD78875.1 tartrate dehydrogenase [Ktedonosporobacter rubrisoli]